MTMTCTTGRVRIMFVDYDRNETETYYACCQGKAGMLLRQRMAHLPNKYGVAARNWAETADVTTKGYAYRVFATTDCLDSPLGVSVTLGAD